MQSMDLPLPEGIPPWLAAFIFEAQRETDTLKDNGAEQAAAARSALLKKLLGAAQAWLEAELDAGEAAQETGRCEETIRRAVRDGTIPDRRANPKGRHRVRRGDLQKLAAPPTGPYDPGADAQDIARLRRKV
jgi:predicted transcriptional regulator